MTVEKRDSSNSEKRKRRQQREMYLRQSLKASRERALMGLKNKIKSLKIKEITWHKKN